MVDHTKGQMGNHRPAPQVSPDGAEYQRKMNAAGAARLEGAIAAHDTDMGAESKTTRRAAADRIKRRTTAAVKSVKGTAATAARSGAERTVKGIAAAGTVVLEKGSALVHRAASGVLVGCEAAVGYVSNQDWISVTDPTKFLYAGTRGTSRGFEEARLVWESIPEQLRALGPEEVAKRLDGFDWSHIVARSKGGGDEAANGIFEIASLNRSRGAEQMTAAEIEAASKVLTETAFKAALEDVAKTMLGAALAGGAISCVISVLEFGLDYQRGDITREEMYRRIGNDVAKSAGISSAVSGVIAVVALAFPALIPLAAPLMMPLAALAICVVGGKVVHLGKGWYELHQEVWSDRLERRRGRSPDRPHQHALSATLTGPGAGSILEA